MQNKYYNKKIGGKSRNLFKISSIKLILKITHMFKGIILLKVRLKID